MLSKFLHFVDKIVDFIVFISWFMNALLLWLPITNNMILNYLIFGFRNIKAHMLNVVVIFLQILLFVYIIYSDSENIIIANIILILWLIYMVNSILYLKRESKPIFYNVCAILIPFAMWAIYSIFIYGSHDKSSIIIGSCNCTFGLTLPMSNVQLLKHHSINKYLKYITLLISIAYVTTLTYFCFNFALHPPK